MGENPIHVIDLSIVLPGFIVAGVAALGRRGHGPSWLAPWLVFSALFGIQHHRGDGPGDDGGHRQPRTGNSDGLS